MIISIYSLILVSPLFLLFCSNNFVLRTDASDTGLGAVLLQKHGETMFPTAYASKKLTGASKSYATVEKECMAIVWAIDKFSGYLYGRSFTLQTDHQLAQPLSDQI